MYWIQNKILNVLALALFSLLCLLYPALHVNAQQASSIPDEVLDNMLIKFRKVQADIKAQKQYEKELDAIIDQAIIKLDKWLIAQKAEQESRNNNYKPGYKHTTGDLNLFPVWEEIPGPVPSLPEASTTNFNAKFQPYIDKVTLMKKQLSDKMISNVGNQRTDKDEMMMDSKVLANNNVFVQQMGGVDAIMKMNGQERKKVARDVSKNMKSNPGSYTGMQNPGMNAMTQKMMSDPSYREAYNKMSQAQKDAELKKYMGNTIEERNDQVFEKSIHDRNDTYSAANIELLLGKCLQQMQDAAKPFNEGTKLTNSFFSEIYNSIDVWYNKTYATLPETVTHEKRGLDVLIKCKETIVYGFQQKEAASRTILWNLLKSNTKIAFGEFNDFVGKYQWGKSNNASVIDGRYTDPRVAQAVSSLYDEMIRMAGDAERSTRQFKGQQNQYDLIVNGKNF